MGRGDALREYWKNKKQQDEPEPETVIIQEDTPRMEVPGAIITRDVLDRLLFIDEKLEGGLKEFIDSAISPELSLTRILNVHDIRFFRLMTNNLIETWFSTRPPYMNGFQTELIADKVRFRSEIRVRRSIGPDRERVLISSSGSATPQQVPVEQKPPSIWERIAGSQGVNKYG